MHHEVVAQHSTLRYTPPKVSQHTKKSSLGMKTLEYKFIGFIGFLGYKFTILGYRL